MEGHLPWVFQFHLQQVNLNDKVSKYPARKVEIISLNKSFNYVTAVKLLEPSTTGAMENLAEKIYDPQEIHSAMGHTLHRLRLGA